ncbi:MAG: YkgJ family cysteine cluster protein [Polyangiaceae bacterium]|nr:YkgJ family cysteine cluster protein [Polyangiaceae bacterium]
MSTARRQLAVLYSDISTRTQTIAAEHTWWPCKKGCDSCCKNLAAPPAFTPLEWEVLWEEFTQLPLATQHLVRDRVAQLAPNPTPGPVPTPGAVATTPAQGENPPLNTHPPTTEPRYTCPFLNVESGACLVYASRPAICRTYGFYVQRYEGNWCNQILHEVTHREQLVLWGNQETVDSTLRRLSGLPISIHDYFALKSQ